VCQNGLGFFSWTHRYPPARHSGPFFPCYFFFFFFFLTFLPTFPRAGDAALLFCPRLLRVEDRPRALRCWSVRSRGILWFLPPSKISLFWRRESFPSATFSFRWGGSHFGYRACFAPPVRTSSRPLWAGNAFSAFTAFALNLFLSASFPEFSNFLSFS